MSRDPLVALVLAAARPPLAGDRGRALEHVSDWTLEDLEASGLGLVVRSEVLGREVIFASTRWRPRRAETRPVYRVPELRRLATLRPKAVDLRRLDQLREIFLGEVWFEDPEEPR